MKKLQKLGTGNKRCTEIKKKFEFKEGKKKEA